MYVTRGKFIGKVTVALLTLLFIILFYSIREPSDIYNIYNTTNPNTNYWLVLHKYDSYCSYLINYQYIYTYIQHLHVYIYVYIKFRLCLKYLMLIHLSTLQYY